MTRMRNNEHQIFMWANDGSELMYAFPRHAMPIDPAEAMMGPLIARWFVTNGEEGMAPTDENMLKVFDLYRSAGGRERRKRQDGSGDLEDHRRQRVQHRHGRRLAGGDGHPHRQEHDGQHPGASGQHAARPHAAELAPGDVLFRNGG